MINEKFAVTGMTCSACSSRVEKCVSALDGINTCEVIRRQSRGSVCRKFPAGSHAESAEGNEIPADLLLPVLDSADVCVHVPYVL